MYVRIHVRNVGLHVYMYNVYMHRCIISIHVRSVRNRVKLLGGPYPKLLAGLNKGRAHDLAS